MNRDAWSQRRPAAYLKTAPSRRAASRRFTRGKSMDDSSTAAARSADRRVDASVIVAAVSVA
jgi:hypothetical protein